MGLRDFKHVGIRTYAAPQTFTTQQSVLPIGIKTPLELGTNGGGLLQMHFRVEDQVQDNLRNLVLTNFGDRLALYDYGANLQPLVAELTSQEDFEAEAMVRINTAVSKWMPFVELSGFGSTPVFEDNRYTGKVAIVVEYSVSRIQLFKKRLELTLFVM